MSLYRLVCISVLICFIGLTFGPIPYTYAQDIADLPKAGTMVDLSAAYAPVLIKGLKVHPDNPLLFDFILDTGNTGFKASSAQLRQVSNQLIKYFLATLTIPDKDLWVNLSPTDRT